MEIVYLPFLLLGLAFLSCWKSRERGVWAGFAFLSEVKIKEKQRGLKGFLLGENPLCFSYARLSF